MAQTATDPKTDPLVANRSRTSSNSSSAPSLKTPRTPRFAEATAVHSPIEPSQANRSPFADPPGTMTNHYQPQPQPSDVGFGYISESDPSRHATYPGVAVEEEDKNTRYLTPGTPLKSAMKSPGTPRNIKSPLSPTFREEQLLEKQEQLTEKEQAKDLKVKFRVRLAKVVLRGVNFSCSLIVLSMISATFMIFNATKALPARNNLPAWAPSTKPWPQITILVISCISLFMSIVIMFAYWRGGHRRAEKAAVYYTVFAVGIFVFSIIMWGIAAGILNSSKINGQGKDLWGWSCKDNKRRQLFQQDDWSLICCIIEIVVETITIIIYGIVFYRFASKKKLRKSMDMRDKARTDLYLAQLRTQSAPNTPGFPVTPGFPGSPGYPASPGFPGTPRFPQSTDAHSQAEEGLGSQFATHQSFSQPKPFALQPPPIKVQGATPQPPQEGFEPAPAAPGEQQYGAVPIPQAYASPMASPSYPPTQSTAPGQAFTASTRVESPPTSPRFPPPPQSRK
ncbi:hypothetical protein FGG08_003660 [Glutinoglossum americanum]|uniref:Uncharacterized protein n=1 Tax=Glutinoglossum americanum TaxID=1670608 RepID=A0A9P8I2A0_9PEZI|nr:hypothetical protein FGG08_003660 [Glutinoglossum americanum]